MLVDILEKSETRPSDVILIFNIMVFLPEYYTHASLYRGQKIFLIDVCHFIFNIFSLPFTVYDHILCVPSATMDIVHVWSGKVHT